MLKEEKVWNKTKSRCFIIHVVMRDQSAREIGQSLCCWGAPGKQSSPVRGSNGGRHGYEQWPTSRCLSWKCNKKRWKIRDAFRTLKRSSTAACLCDDKQLKKCKGQPDYSLQGRLAGDTGMMFRSPARHCPRFALKILDDRFFDS